METHEARILVKTIQKKDPSIFNIEYSHLTDLVPLASGNFGDVYCGYYKRQKVAVKKLIDVDDEKMHKYLQREISTLRELRHPNIIEFLGLCKHSSGLYLVTEFVQGGDLRKVLKNHTQEISWANRIRIAYDVCCAMSFLHSKSIIHRDLKSHNVLVFEESNAKVCDFGFSRKLPKGKRDKYLSVCGTDQWMAPEVLMGDSYDEKADVFSYAMLLTELITRQKPPERPAHTMYAFSMDQFRERCPSDTPKLLIEIVGQCSVLTPSRRPKLADIEMKLDSLLGSSLPSLSFTSQELNVDANATVKHVVRVIRNYQAKDTVELSLKKGDRLVLVQMDESGWCEGLFHNKRGWFPSSILSKSSIKSLNASNMKPGTEAVDHQSLTSMEHRSHANQQLLNFLHTRPAPEFLAERNILQSTDPRGGNTEFTVSMKKLEKKKKIDALSSFFRKKASRKKSIPQTELDSISGFEISENALDQLVIFLYEELTSGSQKYNGQVFEDCFLGLTLVDLLMENGWFSDSSTARQFIVYAIKRNILRSVEATFDGYTDKLPLRLQMHSTSSGVMNDVKYSEESDLDPLSVAEELLREIASHPGFVWAASDRVRLSLNCSRLQKVNMSNISNEVEKLVFFVNLYNVMKQYFLIRFGSPGNDQAQVQNDTKLYFIVDSVPYSLDIIKRNILFGLTTFKNDADPRKEHVLEVDPLVYFTLTDNGLHAPPLEVYRAKIWEDMKKQQLKTYFASSVMVSGSTIVCSKYLKEYSDIFYGGETGKAFGTLTPYLSSKLQEDYALIPNPTFEFVA